MKKTELVFVPSPVISHLLSTIETAKLLTDRDDRLSITVLIMKLPTDSKISSYTQSEPTSRIRFIDLPYDDSILPGHPTFLFALIESHKPQVREIAAEIARSESARLAGFVLDMFCGSMIDVANEFGVPSYIFFTSSAAFLGLVFHFQSLQDDHKKDISEFKDSDADLPIPSFRNPVPSRVLPSELVDKESGASATLFLGLVRRFREMKGIIVNSFVDLESYAVDSFSNGLYPPIYPVGPILNLNGTSLGGTPDESQQSESVIRWLDDQPVESVVFLCFGSMGSFGSDQVREIAIALERSGCRFVWSLRQPPKGKFELPGEYADLEDMLPYGFLERTVEMGKIIGWAPQVTVLSHPSVGGFVSHCGWNSILESMWSGVPIATWPMYAEQQMNAFELVKELEFAVEIKIDYMKDFRSDSQQMVTSDEIESGIRKLMVERNDVREKVKRMREKSRATMVEGGSSYTSIGHFIQNVIENVSVSHA